ncbi:MAG: hypothetical protein PQ975_05300 [Methanobacterium sp.]|jgi:hypothetical protein
MRTTFLKNGYTNAKPFLNVPGARPSYWKHLAADYLMISLKVE